MRTFITIIAGIFLFTVLTLWLLGERWRLINRSTWRVMKTGGLRNLINLKTFHAYIYLRWSSLYVKAAINRIIPGIAPRISKKIKHWLADHYHGKVLTPDLAQAIIKNHQDILHHDLEQIIPYSMARHLVLNGPPDIAVTECPCRDAREEPCQPSQVCMIIGQPFVDFTLEHHPKTSRRLNQSEALYLLRSEYEKGHIHTAWFKDVCLDRFFVICNCCRCCCGGIEAMVKYGMHTLVSSGYVAEVDESRCESCGICERSCPFSAIYMDEISLVDWNACMGCGVCAGCCPNEAIALVRDEKKGIPLDIRILTKE